MRLPDAADNLVPAPLRATPSANPSSRRQKLKAVRPLAGKRQRTERAPDDALKLALDTALDAVVVMRADGAIADWNAMAEKTFGWTAAEVAGRQLAELIIPARLRADHYTGLAAFHATGY